MIHFQPPETGRDDSPEKLAYSLGFLTAQRQSHVGLRTQDPERKDIAAVLAKLIIRLMGSESKNDIELWQMIKSQGFSRVARRIFDHFFRGNVGEQSVEVMKPTSPPGLPGETAIEVLLDLCWEGGEVGLEAEDVLDVIISGKVLAESWKGIIKDTIHGIKEEGGQGGPVLEDRSVPAAGDVSPTGNIVVAKPREKSDNETVYVNIEGQGGPVPSPGKETTPKEPEPGRVHRLFHDTIGEFLAVAEAALEKLRPHLRTLLATNPPETYEGKQVLVEKLNKLFHAADIALKHPEMNEPVTLLAVRGGARNKKGYIQIRATKGGGLLDLPDQELQLMAFRRHREPSTNPDKSRK